MRILLFLISCCVLGNSFAQNFSFISYSNADGLPQSQVQCITQDKTGYIWVGTLGGLARFNGTKFNTFSIEKGLLNNRISCIQAIGNDIWVGHEGGITKITEQKAISWTLNGNDQSANVTDIILYKGEIIASVEGGGIYRIKNGKLIKSKLPNADAATCRDLEIIHNKLYIGTRDGIYVSNDAIHFQHISKFQNRSVASIKQLESKILVATFSKGFFQTTESFTTFDSIPLVQSDFYNTNLFIDRSNNQWLLSPDGIIRMKNKATQLFLNEQKGLPSKSINCAFQDKEGNLWFGSEGKGLLRLASQTLVNYSIKTGLPSEFIVSCIQENPVHYYFGTYDKGVFQMKLNGEAQSLAIPATTVWGMEKFNGSTWFATDQGLFNRTASGKIQLFNFSDKPSTVRLVKKLSNSKLLIASEDYMGWVTKKSNEIANSVKLNAAKNGIIRDAIYYNSRLLCGTSTGLFQLSETDNKLTEIKTFKSGLACLNLDDQNRLWIGTENGLYLYDGIEYKSINIGNNSGARFINFITKNKETIFVGTNDGVFVYDCSYDDPKLIKHLGLNNGLINLETNINSGYFDGNYMWFGTVEGLHRINTQHERFSSPTISAPRLVITDILLNYQKFNFSDYSSGISKNGLPVDLKLPYSKNNITIDLDGLLFSDPSSVTFQYWLEGLGETWSPRTTNPTIILNNLPDGDFILHIRAISETGVFSDHIDIPLIITPPFWRRWWFFVIVALVIGLGIRGYFRWQIRRERERNYKENLENKTRLLALEQQSLNASMNRHFIFNSLNSIQYFINTQDKLSANRYLTNFAKLIRKNLDSAAEGDNIVTLAQELERLELYLSLESMRFKDRFTYIIDDAGIDTENILVPAMLLQPFVENSIIHGILPDENKKGEIKVIVKALGNQLEICLDDNGIGIDFSLTKKAAFKGDHKSQGMEITSKRISLIRKMWKKDYELIGPFQMTNSDSSIKGTRVLIKIPLENLEN